MASIIPENTSGKAIDIEQYVEEGSIEQAIKIFDRAAARLVNPPVWHKLAGSFSAEFSIYAQQPDDDKRQVRVSDYLMIDIPGPGTGSGDGYDWVIVEELQVDGEPGSDSSIALRLRASSHPDNEGKNTDHFFTREATSTFIFKREGKRVTVSYHGRNEKANTEEVKGLDKIRNTVIAAGAKAGLSELQWKALLIGFLQPETGG